MCITITSSPKKEEKVDLKLCYEFVEDVYSHWDPHGNYLYMSLDLIGLSSFWMNGRNHYSPRQIATDVLIQWRGGGGANSLCARIHILSFRYLGALSCYLSLIFKYFDTKWYIQKNHSRWYRSIIGGFYDIIPTG